MFSSWNVNLFLDIFNPNYISLKIKSMKFLCFSIFLLALVERTISDKLKFYFLTSMLDSRCLSINLYNIEINFYFFTKLAKQTKIQHPTVHVRKCKMHFKTQS